MCRVHSIEPVVIDDSWYNIMHKGNPPKRADTIVYYDSIAIGKKCKDLKLDQEKNSCKKIK